MRDKGKSTDTIGQRIRRARLLRGMTQSGLAAELGTVAQRVSEWERGFVAPSEPSLRALARALGVSLDWLIANSGPMDGPAGPGPETGMALVPVYGMVPAGPPYDPGDPEVVGLMGISPEHARRDVFGLVVRGDSMAPTLRDGDRILVARDEKWADGRVVVVRVNRGEYTVKRLRIQDDLLVLSPDNPGFPPIVLAPEDEPEIVGIVIEVSRRVI